ncbi:MAG: sugar transferase [bacterium]|nr:MAG: sugar transferase [bacterium]
MNIFLVFILSFLTSLGSIYWIKKIAQAYKIGSLPSPRKLHKGFKPLLGGLGITLGIFPAILLAQLLKLLPWDIWFSFRYFWSGLLIILLIGLWDDLRGISSKIKFAGEGIAAVLLILGGCKIQSFAGPFGDVLDLGIFSVPFTFLWIIFIINAINLLDGLDGLAGGVGLIITFGMLVIAVWINNSFILIISITLIGAILGFMRYNYHPASIFMGEVGSLQLGYLMAFFSIEAMKMAGSQQVYFLVSLVIFAVPMTDTLVAFLRRLGQGKSPFLADKEHIHHRLIKLGLSHLQTVWLIYFLTIFYTVSGVLIFYFKGPLGILLFCFAFFLAIFWIYRLGYVETRLSWQNLAYQFQQAIPVKSRAPLHFNRIWHRFILILGDIITLNLALFVMHWLKFQSGFLGTSEYRPISEYFISPVFLLLLLVWILLFFVNNLYHLDWDMSRTEKTWRVTKVITFGLLILALITLDFEHMFKQSQVLSLSAYWALMVILVNSGRLVIIAVEKKFNIFEYSPRKTLIVGTTDLGKKVYRDVQYNPHLIYKVVGFISKKLKSETFLGIPVLGIYSDLPELIHRHKIEEIIIALPDAASQDFIHIVSLCEPQGVKIKTIPGRHEYLTSRRSNLVSHAFVQVFSDNMVLWQWIVKRLSDAILAAMLMILLFPFFLVSAFYLFFNFRKKIWVKVPIVGKNGIPFDMYTFRLSENDYDYQKNAIYLGTTPPSTESRKYIQFLFRYRFYKLPQLLNVFLGDMSFVGPRPEPVEWYEEYSSVIRFSHRRITVRPGLTGLAQVKYHYELSRKTLQEWVKFDMYYTENLSLRMDSGILLRSLFMVFVKRYKNSNRKKR